MGFSISLVASDNIPLTDLLSQHKLRATKSRSEYSYRGDNWALEGHGDWKCLIESENNLTKEDAKKLSLGGNAFYLTCETYSMSIGLYTYANGVESFSLEHVSENGIEHLDATGELPQFVQRSIEEAREELAADDDPPDHLFDVPLQYVRWMTGFHPEGMELEDEEPFIKLETLVSDR